jgi:hypothetical protein
MVVILILIHASVPFPFPFEKGRIRTGGAAGADPLGGEGRYISPGDGLFAGSIGRMVTTVFLDFDSHLYNSYATMWVKIVICRNF